ncbi:MAG: hypothetical protein EXS14_07800, partial [Planctomycetes bacterium]|nr:hypothetical protein [Planctomycetota bacterium]
MSLLVGLFIGVGQTHQCCAPTDWVLWGDGAVLHGSEGLNRLHSWGLDFAAMWAPSGTTWHPSLYAGWAK